jgi:transposase, IS5 family
MGGSIVRTIGLQRAKVKIGLMNLVYNMIRLVQLIKLNVKVAEQALVDKHREAAPDLA